MYLRVCVCARACVCTCVSACVLRLEYIDFIARCSFIEIVWWSGMLFTLKVLMHTTLHYTHLLLHLPFRSCQPLFLSLMAIWTCLFPPLYLPLCLSHWFGECVKIQAIVLHWMRQSLHGTVPLGMHLSQTMSLSLLPLCHRKCVSGRECVPIYSNCIVDECQSARCNSLYPLV